MSELFRTTTAASSTGPEQSTFMNPSACPEQTTFAASCAGPEWTDAATFTPQLVPIDFSCLFLRQLFSANTYPAVLLNQLPQSLKLLLQIGADLLGVAIMDLYEAVVTVEKRLVFWQFKEGCQHFKTTILDAFEMSLQFSRTLLHPAEDSGPSHSLDDSNPPSPL